MKTSFALLLVFLLSAIQTLSVPVGQAGGTDLHLQVPNDDTTTTIASIPSLSKRHPRPAPFSSNPASVYAKRVKRSKSGLRKRQTGTKKRKSGSTKSAAGGTKSAGGRTKSAGRGAKSATKGGVCDLPTPKKWAVNKPSPQTAKKALVKKVKVDPAKAQEAAAAKKRAGAKAGTGAAAGAAKAKAGTGARPKKKATTPKTKTGGKQKLRVKRGVNAATKSKRGQIWKRCAIPQDNLFRSGRCKVVDEMGSFAIQAHNQGTGRIGTFGLDGCIGVAIISPYAALVAHVGLASVATMVQAIVEAITTEPWDVYFPLEYTEVYLLTPGSSSTSGNSPTCVVRTTEVRRFKDLLTSSLGIGVVSREYSRTGTGTARRGTLIVQDNGKLYIDDSTRPIN